MRLVVVGSGVAGAALAWELARAGADVVVVDDARSGAATLAGAGIVKVSGTLADRRFSDLLATAVAGYADVVADLAAESGRSPADLGYRDVGGIWVAEDPSALDAVEADVSGRDASEIGTLARLDPEQAREAFPPLAPGLHALHISRAARVDGRSLRAGLLDAAARHGAQVRSGRVTLDRTGSGTALVHVDGVQVPADEVVLAAGAWTPEVLAGVGLGLALRPQRGQISHLGLGGVDTSRWCVVSPLAGHYLLAFDDSRVVAGATREAGTGFDERVTAAGQAEVLAAALRAAPGLADATLLETRVGFRPMSDDGAPIVGRVPDVAGLSLVTGYGASGLTLAPHLARRWADVLLDGVPAPDLAWLDPARAVVPGA